MENKTKIPKLSFKREKRERGLSAVGNPNPNVKIKSNRRTIGIIYGPTWRSDDDLWKVSITIKETAEKSNCPWKWMSFKLRHETEEAARAWIEKNWEKINKSFDIYDADLS